MMILSKIIPLWKPAVTRQMPETDTEKAAKKAQCILIHEHFEEGP